MARARPETPAGVSFAAGLHLARRLAQSESLGPYIAEPAGAAPGRPPQASRSKLLDGIGRGGLW
jgi:hypothetical protein